MVQTIEKPATPSVKKRERHDPRAQASMAGSASPRQVTLKLKNTRKKKTNATPDRPAMKRYYLKVFSASPTDRIGIIREGLPARDAKNMLLDLGVEQKTFFQALGLKTATVNRKIQNDLLLPSDESERLLGVAKLIGHLQTIVDESGDPQGFDASKWMARWLRESLPAFGGKKPIDFLDTMEGQALVADALARIQSGAYA